MTVTLHTWMIPTAVTVCAATAAWALVRFDAHYDADDKWNGLGYAVMGSFAFGLSALAWLVWALV